MRGLNPPHTDHYPHLGFDSGPERHDMSPFCAATISLAQSALSQDSASVCACFSQTILRHALSVTNVNVNAPQFPRV